jgi:hypothetical protein
MKKVYLIGNMKMNMSYAELEPYFANITQIASTSDNVVGVCLPSVYIDYAKYSLENSKVLYGAQNIYYADKGAFTGEISAHMLNDFGCDLVIIGHSERRNIFHESDEEINLKVKKALDEGITPILCFGELKEEREGGMAFSVVERQLVEGLKDLKGLFKQNGNANPKIYLQDLLNRSALSGSQIDMLFKRANRIPIITVHQSKGCEFDLVIIAGVYKYNFPSAVVGDTSEEKNIFYVAISRAKKKLIITSPSYSFYGKPLNASPYIDKIPSRFVKFLDYQ